MKIKDLSHVVLVNEIVRVYLYDKDKKPDVLSEPYNDVYCGPFKGLPDSILELEIKMLFAYRSKLNIEV